MRSTKKLTLSAMSAALSAVILMLSSFFEVMELTVGAVASMLVVFVFIEIKGAYPYLVWLVTSVIAILLFPSKTIGCAYFLVFGIYPILKSFFEKTPHFLSLILKLLYFTAVGAAFIFVSELVLGVPFFSDLPNLDGVMMTLAKAGFVLLCYIAFFAYDMFISVMTKLYFLKFRDKIKRLL